MILESIVTTVDRAGRVNIAPMGPRVQPELAAEEVKGMVVTLRPFTSSQTYRNLTQTGGGVIHVTDDAGLFAKAAVDAIDQEQAKSLVRRVDDTPFRVLRDCHRWFAVKVESNSGEEPRADLQCRVVLAKTERPFFGFNRAKHAVIEAAIVATRTHILPAQEIREQIDRLQPLIDKTAGEAEHSAFEFLRKTIHERLRSE